MPQDLPDWFRKGPCNGLLIQQTREILQQHSLNTVCTEAHCPNQGECYEQGTAAFLILGNTCTRQCGFCNVRSGDPQPLDQLEPENLARAVALLKLSHVVVTSVTRDDLSDGGAMHYAKTIRAIRERMPKAVIEVLIPDFLGRESSLLIVLQAGPDIVNHNLETVPRLYPMVRPQGDYRRSLELLSRVRGFHSKLSTKSGIMLGLGETFDECSGVFRDLQSVGCDMVTAGQYLRPGKDNVPVIRYVRPEEFEAIRKAGQDAGIPIVFSGPFVRSSYHAGMTFRKFKNGKGSEASKL